ncbi:hypothetical protein [Nocardia nova]|uniref:hypothetical protein n=1 Tax=Nocardia nova TaxID=37330 RepID=UPI0018954170|nr:hypothetical protein [Nocardia nova]MBF6277006.1 hypothetical protein [Nocardia nova]
MKPDDLYHSPAPQEPSGNSREFARAIRDLFIGLVAEGFTESQALSIISNVVSAKIAADNDK